MGAPIKVKICGQTSLAGADMSLRLGADFIGVVLEVASSPRSLDLARAEPIFQKHGPKAFLLTCAMPVEKLKEAINRLRPYALQLTGNETPDELAQVKGIFAGPVFKSIHLKPAGSGGAGSADRALELMTEYQGKGADGFVLDTATGGKFGGTGVKSDWSLAGRVTSVAPKPTFIAGGINPENVVEAAALPGIYGVDMASGVEEAKGVKSEKKLMDLFNRLRNR